MFENGAGLDSVEFAGSAERSFGVGWTLTLLTPPGAEVRIADNADSEVFRGKADAEGRAVAELIQYLHEPEGKTMLAPHVVTIAHGGKSSTKSVTMDSPRAFRVTVSQEPTMKWTDLRPGDDGLREGKR